MKLIITLGFLLVFIGVLIIFVGTFYMAYHARKGGGEMAKPEVRGGGIIMIGPIPIIFGTDTGALKLVMILAVVLMVIATIMLLLLPRML